MSKLAYPRTKSIDQVDNYHGVEVSDPYRWLEDVDSPETGAWIDAENKLTFSYLENIPERERIHARLSELWDYPKYAAPLKRGGRYFQLRNSGLQNQDVLYVKPSLTDDGRVLLDPNTLSEDGTVALTEWQVSKDGRYLAYATSKSGSDWLTWRIREVETGQDLPDRIDWSKFSNAAWLPDSFGFYYSRYDAPVEGQAYEDINENQKVYFHRLGTPQSEDVLVYARPDHKEWGFDAKVSDDGRYLLLHVSEGTAVSNRFFYRDLESGENIVELIPVLEAAYRFIGNDGPVFYFLTNLDAPRGRLIATDTENPGRQNWETLIPEGEHVLEHLLLANDQFIALYMDNAHHLLKRIDLMGKFLGDIPLPGLGSIFSLNGNYSLHGNRKDDELFYSFQSFVTPPTVFSYDFDEDISKLLYSPEIDFDFSAYRTEQVFVSGKDGTKIPMFLVHRNDYTKNGDKPALLYGYGGFNISLLPTFMVSRLIWLEMGGVLAVANLRGGGEYGEEWHQAGCLANKQNVFDDMIACAKYLISEKITNPDRLAIEGRSNGGLLVGACITQRPDLFGAALPAVGVMDMLRFHRFTIGWAWTSDYGCADDPEGFRLLYAYSPLHNIKQGTHYPATLVTTADRDDRVVPGHSFKFAAALQNAQAGEEPILIRIQTRAGHGFGKPTSILIQEQSDIWAFLVKELDMHPEI